MVNIIKKNINDLNAQLVLSLLIINLKHLHILILTKSYIFTNNEKNQRNISYIIDNFKFNNTYSKLKIYLYLRTINIAYQRTTKTAVTATT